MILPLSYSSISKYPDIYLFDIPSTAILGVIFGYQCDENLAQYIILLKRKFKPLNHLEIYKAIPNLDEYKIDMELLEK